MFTQATQNNDIAILRQSSRQLVREFGLLNSKPIFGVTSSEGHVLLELAKHQVLTVAELARILLLEKSTISRVVFVLQEKGWVQYRDKASDRRQKPVILTQEGHEQLEKINSLVNKKVVEALQQLSPEQQKTVCQGLSLYAKALIKSRSLKEFTIRPIQREDNAALANVIRKVSIEFATTGEGGPTSDPELDNLYEAYHHSKAAYFVVCRGKQILGGGGFSPLKGEEKNICELQKMYLLPEARGFGLGEAIVKKCLQLAQEKGFHSCYLETAERMKQAQSLYKKLGFKQRTSPLGNTGHFQSECWYQYSLK